MSYTSKAFRAHPGFNPKHNPDFISRKIKVFNPKTRLVETVGFEPRNPSRWVPHQGARECARRRRQAQGGAK